MQKLGIDIGRVLIAPDAPNGRADTSAEQPLNVVIIFADDLGYGDLGCYGHPQFETPHIDRLASEGIRLTNFYVPVPYCAPSRASLLTGRYPFRHGLVRNPTPDRGVNDVGIPADELLLAEVLGNAGYVDVGQRKLHSGNTDSTHPRCPRRGGRDYRA